jgi:hypothetical protein
MMESCDQTVYIIPANVRCCILVMFFHRWVMRRVEPEGTQHERR